MESKSSPTKSLQTPRKEREQRASVRPRRRRGPDLATRRLLLTEVPVDLEDLDQEKEEILTLSTMKSTGDETGAVEGPDLANVDLISKTRWSECEGREQGGAEVTAGPEAAGASAMTTTGEEKAGERGILARWTGQSLRAGRTRWRVSCREPTHTPTFPRSNSCPRTLTPPSHPPWRPVWFPQIMLSQTTPILSR